MDTVLRILHLEDDPRDVEIIQGVLEADGIACDVRRVETREQFVTAVEEGAFDLILADCSLPGFDGISALEIAACACPDVPFIFVSGTLDEEQAISTFRIGAVDYVSKERIARIPSSVRRALGQARDQIDREQAEERLRRSEAFLAEGQRISHTGSWEWILSTGKVTWSDEQFRVLGFEPRAVEPSLELFLSALHPDDRPRVRRELEEATGARRAYAIDYRISLQDGSLRHLRSVGRPVAPQTGAVDEYIGTTSDVTELVRSEAALRARQEMLDLAQKAARAAAFEWHIGGGGENRWSADLDAMFGLAPGAYDGTFETWHALVHPEDRETVMDAIANAVQSGDVAAEYRLPKRDSAVCWLQMKARAFFDGAGHPMRIVGFMIDVTERRNAEEELRRREVRLRQTQRLEALGTLAAGIAHDFNNILGSILGYGEMAMREAPLGSRLRRDIDSILVAGERGRALIDRILAFSRSGVSATGERVPVHVEKVVREALGLLEGKLPPAVRVEAKLNAGRAAILGDPTQVYQVLVNLGTNAIQAMPAGGTLTVSVEAARFDRPHPVTIGALARGDYVVLRVADTGSGMAADIIDRIFDPFFTTRDVGIGTGLGLSLVHGIVTELGGAIDVESELGVGSVFTVYVRRACDDAEPRDDNAMMPRRNQDVATMPRGNGERVLIVDDEEPLVALATRILAELGYEPMGFTSSTAALSAFRAEPERFQALITDERMPGLSGTALIREIRDIRESIPVVLMSGFVGGLGQHRARAAGANEVLDKPLSAHEIAASLARALQS